jgi:DNA modification methylase
MAVKILAGDVFAQLKNIPDESIDCVVTSPPYWGLRDYGIEGQLGLEKTLGEHIGVMVSVFREIRRVLKKSGTAWVNYGDCFATLPNGRSAADTKAVGDDDRTFRDKPFSTIGPIYDAGFPARTIGTTGSKHSVKGRQEKKGRVVAGGYLKPKDLCMVPNRLAIALQDDGWWIRQEIVWHKTNPMPESVTDRPASAHEKIFMLSKSEAPTCWHHRRKKKWVWKKPRPDYIWFNPETGKESLRKRSAKPWRRVNLWRAFDYYYDADAVRQNLSEASIARLSQDVENQAGSLRANGGGKTNGPMKAVGGDKQRGHGRRHQGFNERWDAMSREEQRSNGAHLKNVWSMSTKGFSGAHFATFPPELPETCIKAACPPKGVVLDPFAGAGTTGMVADRLGREAILIELNPEYINMAARRIEDEAPILAKVEVKNMLSAKARKRAPARSRKKKV